VRPNAADCLGVSTFALSMVFLGPHCSQHASLFPSAMSFACETVIRIGWPQSQHHARKSFEPGIR
jgi:hypothetical protein